MAFFTRFPIGTSSDNRNQAHEPSHELRPAPSTRRPPVGTTTLHTGEYSRQMPRCTTSQSGELIAECCAREHDRSGSQFLRKTSCPEQGAVRADSILEFPRGSPKIQSFGVRHRVPELGFHWGSRKMAEFRTSHRNFH